MSTIIISIKPEYVSLIMNGDKLYEYRKVACRKRVDKMLIYSSSPVSKIVGEAEIDSVLIDTPTNIWEKTSKYAGIDQKTFKDYYSGKKSAVAYRFSKVLQYDTPKALDDYGIKTAPQSFYYIKE